MDDCTRYAWLDEEQNDTLAAGCLGVTLGAEDDHVRAAFSVEETSLGDVTLDEAWKLSTSDWGNDIVQIAGLGSALVTVEPNGWTGVDEGIAGELSRHGSYAGFFWNVNAQMQFVYATDGVVRRSFDPLLYDHDREAAHALPEERDLPFPRGDGSALTPRRAALALVERLTGVEITRSWFLGEARATYRR